MYHSHPASGVDLSPLARNLDISAPVVRRGGGAASFKAATGNLAPRNAPPPPVPPPPPTTPPPSRAQKSDRVSAVTVPAPAARTSAEGRREEKGSRRGGGEAEEGERGKGFKAPTTFFSHETYYAGSKRIDASKYRAAAESTYGRRGTGTEAGPRGRATMSRARDVAIAGSALRTKTRSASPTVRDRNINTNGNGNTRAALHAKNAASQREEISLHKRRVMRALDVEREEMPDGCIMFRFSEKHLSAQEVHDEQERVELLHVHADEYQPDTSVPAPANLVSRWAMTVRFLASTLSLESAAFYVLTTPFRTGFWTAAYTARLLWWLCSGRMLPGRAARRARAVRVGGGGGRGGGGGGEGEGGGGGVLAATDAPVTSAEAKLARAGKGSGSAGNVNRRDMRNVLLG